MFLNICYEQERPTLKKSSLLLSKYHKIIGPPIIHLVNKFPFDLHTFFYFILPILILKMHYDSVLSCKLIMNLLKRIKNVDV